MKKLLSILLCLTLLFGIIPTSALTASADVGDYEMNEYESNNSMTYADRVYNDYTVTGTVSGTDMDFFKFTLSSRSAVQIITIADYRSCFLAGIFNSSENAVAVSEFVEYSDSGYPTYLTSVTLNAGTYYYVIFNEDASTLRNDYLFYITYTSSSSHTHSYTNACDTSCNTCGATRTITHSYAAATCTAPKTCTVCGVTSGSASGHTYTNSCDASCNTCGATRTAPHAYSNDCDPSCNSCGSTRVAKHKILYYSLTNSSTYPFSLSNGIYTSTNKSNSTSATVTLNIKKDFTLQINYYTSTESGYDKLIIAKNGTTVVTASGSTAWTTKSLSVKSGDTITFTYSKDSSSASGNDEVKFELGEAFMYTDDLNISCGDSIICDVCKTSLSPSSSHQYSGDCDTTCNNCGAVRTATTHTYTNSCDTNCDVCDYSRTVTHNYQTTTQKATFSNDGSIVKTCSLCNATIITKIYSVKSVELSATSFTYDGKAKNPTVVVKDSAGKTLKKDIDYKIVYQAGRANAGTYKVTVVMQGNYSGSKVLTFKINPINVSKCKVSLSASAYTYDGKAKTPNVTVKNAAGKTLKKNTDYTVVYQAGRNYVGTYKVTVKMKGNYTGSKALTFSVKPTTKTSISMVNYSTVNIGAKSNKAITYSTSNKKIAIVNSKGVITSKCAGTATITVKSNNITQKITVRITNPYVKISGSNSMLLKKSVTLKASTNTGAKVKWSSSNTKIATVTVSGKVTGVKAGSAYIYAKVTYRGRTYSAKYAVTVKNPSLSLNKTSLTLDPGNSFKLVATSNPKVTVKFKSSNNNIARVSSSGKIVSYSPGNANITAYFTYGGKTYSKICKVRVTTKYTGTGIGKITNINLPAGDYILKMVATGLNEDVIENCFVRLYNGGSSYATAHASETISVYNGNGTVTDSDPFEGPIKNGTIKVDTSDDIRWTVTITPY